VPYLIDGNNLLGSWGPRQGPADGRLEVVRRVSSFCRDHGSRATIVFDGRPLRDDRPEQQLGPVTVRFPAQGEDADTVIRRIIDAAASPEEWIVVSSDKPVYEWNALARARRPSTRGREALVSEKPERERDVEGWVRRFSDPRSTDED
jgi:predicted RNA-binding protein with PIN domain